MNRKVPKLRDYGAEKDADGVWHVPVTAIEAVGWKIAPDTSGHVTPDTSLTHPDMSPEISRLTAENADLRERLVRAEADADKWQMLAAERLQNLDDLRRSQRLLEARESTPAPEPENETPAPSPTQPAPTQNESLLGRWRRGRASR